MKTREALDILGLYKNSNCWLHLNLAAVIKAYHEQHLLWKSSFNCGSFLATATARYLAEELLKTFWNFSRKFPLRSPILVILVNFWPKTLLKHDLTADVFLQILGDFQNNFSLAIFGHGQPLDGICLFHKKNNFKLHPRLGWKHVTYLFEKRINMMAGG